MLTQRLLSAVHSKVPGLPHASRGMIFDVVHRGKLEYQIDCFRRLTVFLILVMEGYKLVVLRAERKGVRLYFNFVILGLFRVIQK